MTEPKEVQEPAAKPQAKPAQAEEANRINGKVIGKGDKPISNVTIQFSQNGEEVLHINTDANGEYVEDLLLPGSYTITASKDGYVSGNRTINLESGKSITVEFKLRNK